MEHLEQRIADLERRANRYRNALVMLVLALCAVAVVGATTDDRVIVGRALFLQNKQGQVVISMGSDDGGSGTQDRVDIEPDRNAHGAGPPRSDALVATAARPTPAGAGLRDAGQPFGPSPRGAQPFAQAARARSHGV